MKAITFHRCFFVLIVAGFFATEKASTCKEDLVDAVTDDKLTASSIYNGDYSADKARLSSSGWSPDPLEGDPWIQVDFGRTFTIMAVVTKGLNFSNLIEYVKKYRVKYSNTGSTWNTVQIGTTNEFIANSDTTTPVTNILPSPVVARYIRLYPTEHYMFRSLRFDVIGCEANVVTTTSSLFAVRPTTTLTAQTAITSLFSGTNWISSANTNTTLSTAHDSITMTTQNRSRRIVDTTVLSSPTTSKTSNTQASTITLHSQDTSTNSGIPLTTTTLLPPTTSTTSRIPPATTTLSPPTTSTTSRIPPATTTLSPPTTSTTSSIPPATTTLSPPTTSTTSRIPTTTMAMSSPITTNISSTSDIHSTLSSESTVFYTTQAGLCTCNCAQTSFTMTPEEVQARIENIVQNLSISKKTTSKYLRSKISAHDTRPEVVYVGSVAIALLCMFASFIVLPDLCTLLRFLFSAL
ncbi:uncharacterized protein LOC128178433 [Crassostrea angulata]|uniref:uncharacterized protein LOC128178433 n=1 Tax=Magallana angulata TaxID=2784310 RepID=UPI0022B10F37|nr:uncharacterized protein LOC128178433 [Crassostrea angulata]